MPLSYSEEDGAAVGVGKGAISLPQAPREAALCGFEFNIRALVKSSVVEKGQLPRRAVIHARHVQLKRVHIKGVSRWSGVFAGVPPTRLKRRLCYTQLSVAMPPMAVCGPGRYDQGDRSPVECWQATGRMIGRTDERLPRHLGPESRESKLRRCALGIHRAFGSLREHQGSGPR